MHYHIFVLSFLCIVNEIITLQIYIITTNNDKPVKLITEKYKKFLYNRPARDELRSEYETKLDKNKCNRHFGSIFGTKVQKMLCLENYYKERKLRNKKQTYKRKRKQYIQPFKEPFDDMTRGLIANSFSADYVDLKDFARSMDADEFSKDYLDVGDLARDDSIESRRAWRYGTNLNKNKVKFRADDSGSASEDHSDEKNHNRFQIIDNKSSENDSGSSASEESKEAKLLYFQGRNRLVKDYNGRKRLQHFLPKRFHWEQDEIKNLGYYWFNGPRGRFAEAVNLY